MTTARALVDEAMGGKSVPFVVRKPGTHMYRAICLRCGGFCRGEGNHIDRYTWTSAQGALRAAQRHSAAHQTWDEWYETHPAWPPVRFYDTTQGWGSDFNEWVNAA